MREKLKPCPCCGREKPMEFVQDSSLVIHCHGYAWRTTAKCSYVAL